MPNYKGIRSQPDTTTVKAVQPYVVLILTGSLPSATILAGLGQLSAALFCAFGGCLGTVLLVVTAKAVDSISKGRVRSSKRRTP